jgi:hypothetical protein
MTHAGRLYHLLINHFSREEFETLCLELGVKYDHLSGNDFLGKARAFIDLMQRRGRLDLFVAHVSRSRPEGGWSQTAGDAQASTPALFSPASGAGVLLDISHRQAEWPRSRPATLFNQLRSRAGALGIDAGFITEPAQFCDADLSSWQGLLMPMPWHQRDLRDDVIEAIVQWVRNGGRIAMLGFELGPRHHRATFNRLAERFGLRFNSDIAVSNDYARRMQKNLANWLDAGEVLPHADWSAGGKPYNQPVTYDVNEAAHPVLAGVSRLCWASACTLTLEPGSRTLVPLGNNWLGNMMENSAQYDLAEEALDTGLDRFCFVPNLPWWPVAAAAHHDLVNNRGSAIAIGTWDVLSHASDDNQNERFVNNLLRWLAGALN